MVRHSYYSDVRSCRAVPLYYSWGKYSFWFYKKNNSFTLYLAYNRVSRGNLINNNSFPRVGIEPKTVALQSLACAPYASMASSAGFTLIVYFRILTFNFFQLHLYNTCRGRQRVPSAKTLRSLLYFSFFENSKLIFF